MKLERAHRAPALADEVVVRDRIDGALCTEGLWPLLHGMPSRARYRDDDWAAYLAATARVAGRIAASVVPTGAVWVDDFERAGVAAALRRLGHTGPIGLFLHTPVPTPDVLAALPWAADLLEQLRAFDLIVVHAEPWAFNLARCLNTSARRPEIAVVPVGIEPRAGISRDVDEQVARLRRSLAGRRLLLGVDPVAHVSGVPERLRAYERLLELEPLWRGAVTLMQVCMPARAGSGAAHRDRAPHGTHQRPARRGDLDADPLPLRRAADARAAVPRRRRRDRDAAV